MARKPLSEGSQKALEMISKGVKTAKEMKEKGMKVNGAFFTPLKNREFVTVEKINLVCECCGHKRTVSSYTITDKGSQFLNEQKGE